MDKSRKASSAELRKVRQKALELAIEIERLNDPDLHEPLNKAAEVTGHLMGLVNLRVTEGL